MIKANLRKIIYTPDITQCAGKDTHSKMSLKKNASHFNGLNFTNIEETTRTRNPKRIILNRNFSHISFQDYNRKGNEPIPLNNKINASSVGYNVVIPKVDPKNLEYVPMRRNWSGYKLKSNLTAGALSPEGEEIRAQAKKMIDFKVSEECKKMNSKAFALWEIRDEKRVSNHGKIENVKNSASQYLTLDKENVASLIKHEIKNKDMSLFNGSYKFKRFKKTGELKKLIENTYSKDIPVLPNTYQSSGIIPGNIEEKKSNNYELAPIGKKRFSSEYKEEFVGRSRSAMQKQILFN